MSKISITDKDGCPYEADECPKICDRYALTYPQIKVVHQKNTGLAGARNKGFELVLGQYVYFLDSDDTVQSDLLEYFDNVLSETTIERILDKSPSV